MTETCGGVASEAYLRRPLTSAARDAVNQHPLAWLDEVAVRAGRQVVRGEPLPDAQDAARETTHSSSSSSNITHGWERRIRPWQRRNTERGGLWVAAKQAPES